MVRSLKFIAIVSACAVMLIFGGCNISSLGSGTNIEFSFSSPTPANSADEAAIYINNDTDSLKLNCTLQVSGGNVSVNVISLPDNKTVWSKSFDKNSDFDIELTDVKADSQYLIKFEATQSKSTKLTITTKDSLVKEIETPDKPSRTND